MIDKPILFSGEMVRAILEGRKTQTRRVIKPQPTAKLYKYMSMNEWYEADADDEPRYNSLRKCPYGDICDRLWVRETWQQISNKPYYRATDGSWTDEPWRPSIFMPRWVSRITLEVTHICVERVQDISEEDAISEGIEPREPNHVVSAVYRYAQLWNSINAKRRYGWDMNPWVWVIEFKRVESQS